MDTSSRQHLLDDLEQIHTQMQEAMARTMLVRLAERTLTFQQLRLLLLLLVDGPARPGELAGRLAVSGATLSGMLDRMTAAGLVTDEAVPSDARGRLVRPTTNGRATVTDLLLAPVPDPRWITDGITDDEIAALLVGLRAILRERRREPDQPG
ncbi:MAG: MarR family winged helix-turn-helix transcriptional regulator [Micrococcales bacterium]|nr:MarR family winged helix-turn-helix transcriptional regulator [Micrococcales bacterium]MCL2666333.1 MarR family winged helix-turn-helix transcriptional regulator [Micrococcales bacterium]